MVPQVHSWISDATSLLSGRFFIECVQVRSNSVTTKMRMKRGRSKDLLCDKGCNHVETRAHTCQVCPAAWGPRIRRHNNILYFVRQCLRRSGYLVELEPQFRTDKELLRPDLLAVRDGSAWIIDVQVVSDSRHFTLSAAHQMKIRKYQHVVPLVQARKGIKDVAVNHYS